MRAKARGAITALGEIGPQASLAVPALIEVSSEKNLDVAAHAVASLVKIDSRSAATRLPSLIEWMRPGHGTRVRLRAMAAVRDLGSAAASAIPVLLEIADEDELAISTGAIEAVSPIDRVTGRTLKQSIARGEIGANERAASAVSGAPKSCDNVRLAGRPPGDLRSVRRARSGDPRPTRRSLRGAKGDTGAGSGDPRPTTACGGARSPFIALTSEVGGSPSEPRSHDRGHLRRCSPATAKHLAIGADSRGRLSHIRGDASRRSEQTAEGGCPTFRATLRSDPTAFAITNAAVAARPPTTTVCQALSKRSGSGEAALDVAEDEEGDQRHDDGADERRVDGLREKVGCERDHAPGDVGEGDGEGASAGSLRVGFFETELEPHHEIDPALAVGTDRVHDGREQVVSQAVGAQDVGDFSASSTSGTSTISRSSRARSDAKCSASVRAARYPPSPMAIAPAATSARPAVTMMAFEATAPERPAARANGTVKPSDMPITMSRTEAEAVKCFSMWAVWGTELSPSGRMVVTAGRLFVWLVAGSEW